MVELNCNDKNNNHYYSVNNKIYLKLNSDQRERCIGEFIEHEKGGIVYKKFDEEKHIHRKTNSWSIPLLIYNKVDSIWFYSKNYNYTIIKDEVKDNIKYFHFMSSGTEKKVYIPLNLWKKTSLNAKI